MGDYHSTVVSCIARPHFFLLYLDGKKGSRPNIKEKKRSGYVRLVPLYKTYTKTSNSYSIDAAIPLMLHTSLLRLMYSYQYRVCYTVVLAQGA